MNLSDIAVITSIILWLLPAIRQYKSNLFYFFLILALEDPIAYGITYLFSEFPVIKMNPVVIHSIAGILLFYSIDFDWNNMKKNRVLNLIIIVGFLIALFTLSNDLFLLIICHFLILSKFIKSIIIRLHSISEINCFYLVLIFYELTILVNLIAVLSRTNTGYPLHYITVIFQLLIAVFFTLFKENSRFLIFSFKPAT